MNSGDVVQINWDKLDLSTGGKPPGHTVGIIIRKAKITDIYDQYHDYLLDQQYLVLEGLNVSVWHEKFLELV